MSLLDLLFYPPLCLAVTFVWAGTREQQPKAIVRHGLVLAGKLTAGMIVLGVILQLLLAFV